MERIKPALNWANYNKHIADDHFYYIRSCIRQNFFPGSEANFLGMLRQNLNKDIYDDARLTTCTGIGYHSDIVPFETIQTNVARHFSLMNDQGYQNMAVSCITTFGIYNEVLDTWHHFPEQEELARKNLKTATGREFVKPANVSHASDIVYKFRHQIQAQAKYSLVNQQTGQPLKIVDHIGCHYAKIFPNKGVGGSEFPKVLTGLIEAWGGQPVDYPERRHCCGFGFRQYLIKPKRSYSFSNSVKKLESMAPFQPDAILTNCPGCAMFLDRWQYVMGQTQGKTYGQNQQGIPVLTYEELAGLVLGIDPWKLGLQMHQVDAEPLFNKMGVTYEPQQKYNATKHKPLSKPTFTGCLSV